MVFDGDIDLAKKLVNPAKKVINKGSSISYEPFEKRVQIWNEIKQNQDQYEDGECGKLIDDLDRHYRSMFDFALLILSKYFQEKDDNFPASKIFTDEELKIYEKIQKYNVFEISDKNDIKKKVIAKDKNFLDLFKEYYLHMDKWVDEIVGNPDIRLTLRNYLKKKWGDYKQKINDAVNDLIKEFDWFRIFISDIQKGIDEIETKEKEKDIEPIEEVVEDGPRLIELGEAKIHELNFIGRTKNKLHGKIEFSGKKFKVQEIQEHSDADISRYIKNVNEKDLKNIPENKYVFAKIKPKKLLGGKTIILKAMFYSRVEKFAKNGLDTYPLELVDINPHISNAMDTSKDERMLLCIASPTGFEKEVSEHIGGKEFYKNFMSNVSVCLVDLVTGKLTINPYDKTAEEFKDIFVLEIDEEKVAQAKTRILETLFEKGGVRLNDFMKRYGDKKQIVEKAFYDLKEEKGYSVKYIKDFKTLVLMEE